MSKLIGTGRLNRSGGSATSTVPADLAERFDLGDDGLDLVYVENEHGEVVVKPADDVSL